MRCPGVTRRAYAFSDAVAAGDLDLSWISSSRAQNAETRLASLLHRILVRRGGKFSAGFASALTNVRVSGRGCSIRSRESVASANSSEIIPPRQRRAGHTSPCAELRINYLTRIIAATANRRAPTIPTDYLRGPELSVMKATVVQKQ